MSFIGRRIRVYHFGFYDRVNKKPPLQYHEGIIFWEDPDNSFDWEVHIAFTIDRVSEYGNLNKQLPKHSWVYGTPYQCSIDLRTIPDDRMKFVDDSISIPLPPTSYGMGTKFIIDNLISGYKGTDIYYEHKNTLKL